MRVDRRPARSSLPASVAVLLSLACALPAHADMGRDKRVQIMKGVVLLMALDRQGTKLVPIGRGSGTVISEKGHILTNHHVVADAATGRLHDVVAVGLPTTFDESPRPTCLAVPSRGTRDTGLDLAIIRCEHEMNGQPLTRAIAWPLVSVGDSSHIIPGDDLHVVGFPGIGGTTVTFSSGKVSGFISDETLGARAWIKTDALISQGVSGGGAFDDEGKLVGVPTQVRWQQGGPGSIGVVRPIERARALVAAMDGGGAADPATAPEPEAAAAQAQNPAAASDEPGKRSATVVLNALTVEGPLTSPVVLGVIRGRLGDLGACYKTTLAGGARPQGEVQVALVVSHSGQVASSAVVRSSLGDDVLAACLATAAKGWIFPELSGDGDARVLFGLDLRIQVAPAPAPAPAPAEQPQGTVVMGVVVDAGTLKPVAGAAALFLRPGVSVRSLDNEKLREQVRTLGFTGSDGRFRTRGALPPGTYGVVIMAKGYKTLRADGEVTVPAGAQPLLDLGTVRMEREAY